MVALFGGRGQTARAPGGVRVRHAEWGKIASCGKHAHLARRASGQTTVVTFTPERTGELVFTCDMNMVHGKLIVED